MFNPFSLKNKRILITGGASGIGRETAVLISKLGGEGVLFDQNYKGLLETRDLCENRPNIYEIDLNSDWRLIESRIKEDVGVNGKLDGMVHCAGIPSLVPLRMLDEKECHKVMKINTYVGMELAKIFSSKKICNSAGGSIVYISSVYGQVGSACNLAYAASKASLIGITKALAIELASKKIRVNCIAPGFIKTDMEKGVKEKFDTTHERKVEKLHPLGYGRPIDIANGIVFLLSEASGWITGIVMNIDGGFTAQ